jgi:MFS family permease
VGVLRVMQVSLLVRDLGMAAAFFGLLGALLIAAGLGALAFVAGPLGAAVTVVIWTFGEMILFPVAATYVSEVAPSDRQGEYMGAYWIALSLAMMPGPWAGTLLMDRFGARPLWIAVGICGV